jgi:hypothetical protein
LHLIAGAVPLKKVLSLRKSQNFKSFSEVPAIGEPQRYVLD